MERKQYTINGRDYDIEKLVTTGTGLYVHEHNTGLYYLLSYDTVVAVYDNSTRRLYRTWNDWSSTTAGHVRRFLKCINYECGTDYTYYDWKTADDMINWYEYLVNNYAVVSIEDGLAENDWENSITKPYNTS